MGKEKKQRLNKIINLLSENKEMEVNEIAELIDVSPMTIRRDLTELEQEDVVKRIHGGAILKDQDNLINNPYIIREQIEKNSSEKSAIGKISASMIDQDDIIFLDSGSTTPYISKNIDMDMKLSVLCYTLENAFEFYQRKNIRLILAGGYHNRDANAFHSKYSIELIKELRADKVFISTGGIDTKLGLTTYFDFEADIKKAMIKSAKKAILVSDSTKFGKINNTFFADLEQFDTIITDSGINNEYKEHINKLGIELIIAETGEKNVG